MAYGLRSIGQVLSVLKSDFPDVSISKIRFLESEGLIAPEAGCVICTSDEEIHQLGGTGCFAILRASSTP